FENARETFVGKEQALGGINYSDALNHAAKNRGGEVALLRQRANRAIEVGRRVVQGNGQGFEGITVTIRINLAKVPFRHAAGKELQALHAAGKSTGDQKRGHSCDQEHDERREPEPAAESPHFLVYCPNRQGKSQNDGRTAGHGKTDGVIQQKMSELQSRFDLVCRLLLEKKKY